MLCQIYSLTVKQSFKYRFISQENSHSKTIFFIQSPKKLFLIFQQMIMFESRRCMVLRRHCSNNSQHIHTHMIYYRLTTYSAGKAGAPSSWPGALTWYTQKFSSKARISMQLKNAWKLDTSVARRKKTFESITHVVLMCIDKKYVVNVLYIYTYV